MKKHEFPQSESFLSSEEIWILPNYNRKKKCFPRIVKKHTFFQLKAVEKKDFLTMWRNLLWTAEKRKVIPQLEEAGIFFSLALAKKWKAVEKTRFLFQVWRNTNFLNNRPLGNSIEETRIPSNYSRLAAEQKNVFSDREEIRIFSSSNSREKRVFSHSAKKSYANTGEEKCFVARWRNRDFFYGKIFRVKRDEFSSSTAQRKVSFLTVWRNLTNSS